MRRVVRRYSCCVLLGCNLAAQATAQSALTWQQVRSRFESANPTLRAGLVTIDEARANEITANLRPNPNFTASLDQLQPFTPNPYQPLVAALPLISFNYLHERGQKRELRLDSAKQATTITETQQQDLIRTLMFSLRNSFVSALQAKAVLALAQENLDYFEHEFAISRDRYQAGDIAQVDLNRLELQRVQYQSDVESARVGLRTAKIQLQQLLNDHSNTDQFDISGPFDFNGRVPPLEDFRNMAIESRPDLKAAELAIEKARTDHKLAVANGTTDPTFTVDAGHNPPLNYFGVGVTIPLRIFDKNQGEKLRTELDITHAERVRDASRVQVIADVDSAYTALSSAVALLQPYKDRFLQLARDVRDTTSFSYQHGQASLLEYLDAQRDYRQVELSYLNLVAAYLMAANQLNLAVAREVIQ